MNLNQAIAIIAAMFLAMLAWNIYELFFSTESIIIKRKTKMNNPKPVFISDPSQRELQKRLDKMQAERTAIEAALIDNYDSNELRRLNLLDHHIEIAQKRLAGQWNNSHETNVGILPLYKAGKQNLINAWV
jgi:hypothetical protein